MDRFSALLNLANSIYAVSRLHEIYNRAITNDNRGEVIPSRVEMLSQMLEAICQYSPENYRPRIDETAGRVKLYNNTYRSLRQQINVTREKGADIDSLIKILEIIRPVTNGTNRKAIEKVLQINQIIKT